MKLLLKLIFREAWYHRARISLAVLATVAMSCMIVWLIGSLDLMVLRFDQDAENYLGHYQIAMIPERQDGATQQGVCESVIKELRKNELVVSVTPARQIRTLMGKMEHEDDEHAAVRRQRSLTGLPTQSPSLIALDTGESPFELTEGRWFSNDSETLEGVMGSAAAASLQGWGEEETAPVKPGDTVICRLDTREFKVMIVGLFEQKLAAAPRGNVGPITGALYVSMSSAETIGPGPAPADFIYVRLREGANTKQFKNLWSTHFAKRNIAMNIIDVDDVQTRLDQTRARDESALMGGAASTNSVLIFTSLVSVLIVFTALSMGVSERTRVFAMLRTVGMSRTKIAVLVFGESVILCFLGWLGGIAFGWGLLQLSVSLQPEFYGTGKTVTLGVAPLLTAGVAALLGSLLAAIVPAWRATRISPLEGMNRGQVHAVKKSRFIYLAMFGALLLTLNPIFMYCDGMTANGEMRQFLYVSIGLPTQIAGCLLLVPAMIVSAETLFTPLVAKTLKLPKELLSSQLSSNLWRTLGTTVSLCVGLGMYAFLEISGYSMLVPYTQSKTLPDTLVTFLPKGLPESEIDTVRKMPGVDSSRFLPLAVDQSKFSRRQSERFLSSGLAEMQTSAVLFGLDIEEAFGKRNDGSRPLVEVVFQEGKFEDAFEKLKSGGRYCLVPDSFAFRTEMHVGDKLELVLPPVGQVPASEEIIEYEICGVVSIHGWLWMNKISGVRKRGYRSGAMLIAPYETVKRDYKLDDVAYFWFDRTLDASGRPLVSDVELEESLQKIADERYLATQEIPETEIVEKTVTHPMVKVNSREYLTDRVNDRADEVIQAAAKIPLILLAISSFGMMGTIAASVRSRRYEFGVLRSLGMTRLELVRLILAETLLISIVVILISLGFGLIGGWCFIGLMRYISGFGGFVSPLTIPLYWLSIGFIVTLLMCFLAALGPAVFAGRTETTRLLQER